jgi:FkbM family methyltransferase
MKDLSRGNFPAGGRKQMNSASLLVRIAKTPLRLVPPTTVTRILQGKSRGKKWIVGASIHGCWLGTYERTKRILFEQTVKPGEVVFDVGANVGWYTLLASALVGNTGRVYAFEPLPENLMYLRHHLELNHIENVEVIAAAVADAPGTALFEPGETRSIGRIVAKGGFPVRVVSLDDLIAAGQLPQPDCLKVDVEGAEGRVLEGAIGLLRHRPRLFLATHGNTVHDGCIALLESLRYSIKILEYDRMTQRGEIFAS